MSTYSIDANLTQSVLLSTEPLTFLKTLPQRHVDGYVGWYNHSVYNPCEFHFCSAVSMVNIIKLGGFDERFANGIGYEDNEFLDRVNRLGLHKIINDDVSVIHQWHPKVYDLSTSTYLWDLYIMNGNLHLKTQNETIIHVKNSYV